MNIFIIFDIKFKPNKETIKQKDKIIILPLVKNRFTIQT